MKICVQKLIKHKYNTVWQNKIQVLFNICTNGIYNKAAKGIAHCIYVVYQVIYRTFKIQFHNWQKKNSYLKVQKFHYRKYKVFLAYKSDSNEPKDIANFQMSLMGHFLHKTMGATTVMAQCSSYFCDYMTRVAGYCYLGQMWYCI